MLAAATYYGVLILCFGGPILAVLLFVAWLTIRYIPNDRIGIVEKCGPPPAR